MARQNKSSYWDNNLSEVEEVVLRCFFPEAEEMTINKIRERCGYSYERVHTALKELEKKKIVSLKKIGKTLVYKPDFSNLYLKRAFHHYMTELLIDFSNKHKIISNAIKTASQEIFGITILFGSYSKGNETKNSDIDLMIVSDSEKQAQNQINDIKIKYGFDFVPAFVKKTEFPKIKQENPELWKDLKDYAIVFNGADLYYYWMYQNEKN